METTAPVLEISGLSVDYATRRGALKALRHVDLTVGAGEIVGIVGESGCGKSTLISAIFRLLAGNARIRGGRILFRGQDLLALPEARMRDLRGGDLSIVFQDPMQAHNPVLSIGRQMVDIQYRAAVPTREKRRRAAEMLAEVGIPDPQARLKQYPFEFSGGMRQRIAIAMALLSRPSLLIADEPTTALDATLEVQIIEKLKQLQREYGCSILFISHHLGVIAELCDRVAVMYAGEVVETGPVRDVFRSPEHPYTRALMDCDPGRIRQRRRILPTIPGEIPDLVDLPAGCAFRARCPAAVERCAAEAPPLRGIAGGRTAACWVARERAVA